jgi:protein TonB
MRLEPLYVLLVAAAPLFAVDPELRIGEAEAKKAAIQRPAPAYPVVARQLKVTGKATVEAVVGESGDVEEVRIVSGSPILTKPAVEAVRKWRFQPFQARGKPAPALVTLSFEFEAQ